MRTFLIGTKALVQYLRSRGYEGVHVHKLMPEDCEGVTLVGNVPLHIAYKAERIVKALMPSFEPIPKEYTLEDMENRGILLVEYKIEMLKASM